MNYIIETQSNGKKSLRGKDPLKHEAKRLADQMATRGLDVEVVAFRTAAMADQFVARNNAHIDARIGVKPSWPVNVFLAGAAV